MSLEVPESQLTSDQLRLLSSFNRALADALDNAIGEGGGGGGSEGPVGPQGPTGETGPQGEPGGTTPVLGGSSLGWYSLADYETANDEASAAANSTAYQSLWNTVMAVGGGTLYVPRATWYHGINSAAAACLISGTALAPKNARITVRGEGEASVLAWGGDAGSGAKNFHQFSNGVWNITFDSVKLIQNRAITNPDGDQHHLITSETQKWSNNENIKVINCTFGVVKGDCVRSVGGQNITGMHAAYAASAASLFPGAYTQPLYPQRVCARYAAGWDGGAITFVGTDTNGTALTEVLPAPIASFTCVAKASLVDGDYVTVIDVTAGTTVLYEFDVAGDGVTGGRTQVDISTDTTATQVATRLRTAILATQATITVSQSSGALTLRRELSGTQVTITTTENVANAGFISGLAQTMIGQKEFKTITSATKAAVGTSAATASLGYDYRVRTVTVASNVFDGFDWLNADPGYLYRAPISVQRSTSRMLVIGNRVRGSNDQLLDMEPTSNGDVEDVIVANNFFDAHDIAAETITLWGNGSRDAIKRTIFTDNVCRNARIACFDVDGILVSNNRIYVPNTGSAPGIAVSKLCRNAQFLDNQIVADVASAMTWGIAIQRNTTANDSANNVTIRGNSISGPMANGGGIFLEDCGNTINISGNVLRNLSTTAATGTGVFVKQTSNTESLDGVRIVDNTCEEMGGGTMHSAYRFTGNAVASKNIFICRNSAGSAVRGVNIDALTTGTWTGYPIVSENGLVGCTTPIVLGAGVYIVIGGQQGGIAQYLGAGTPEGNVIAKTGSTYQQSDGGIGSSFWVKEQTGTIATGWAAK